MKIKIQKQLAFTKIIAFQPIPAFKSQKDKSILLPPIKHASKSSTYAKTIPNPSTSTTPINVNSISQPTAVAYPTLPSSHKILNFKDIKSQVEKNLQLQSKQVAIDLNDTILKTIHQAFVEKLQADNVSIETLNYFQEMQLSIMSNHCIQIQIMSNYVKTRIQGYLSELQNFVNQKTFRSDIEIKIKVEISDNNNNVSVYISPEQILKDFIEKNPLILEFKNTLNANITL